MHEICRGEVEFSMLLPYALMASSAQEAASDCNNATPSRLHPLRRRPVTGRRPWRSSDRCAPVLVAVAANPPRQRRRSPSPRTSPYTPQRRQYTCTPLSMVRCVACARSLAVAVPRHCCSNSFPHVVADLVRNLHLVHLQTSLPLTLARTRRIT